MDPEIKKVLDGESEGCIICGDCLEILKDIPDNSVDLVLTDPPYGTLDGRGKVHKQGNKLEFFNVGDWDSVLPLKWIQKAVYVLKNGCWLAIFTDKLSVKRVWDQIEEVGGRGKQTFYWIKDNPPPQPRKNFCSGVETAVLATKGPVRKWNGGGCTLNYKHNPIVTSNRFPHPTEKPITIMWYLAIAMSCRHDIILDPFCGSGTTCIAAKKLGRRYIGIDISEEYCQISRERLRAEDTGVPVKEARKGQMALYELES